MKSVDYIKYMREWMKEKLFDKSRAQEQKEREQSKGYKYVVLESPDKKHRRYFRIEHDRLPDTKVSQDPVQLEIKQLLAKKWTVVRNSSSGKRRKIQRPVQQTVGQMQRKQQRAYKKFIAKRKKQISERSNTRRNLQKGFGNGSYERFGEPNDGELDINLTVYANFISMLRSMQAIGGGKRLAKVGIDVEPVDFMIHFQNKLDFEPFLYTPQFATMKRVLLTVDSSGSCAHLVPLTRALGKRLAERPELQLDYTENFNGELYAHTDEMLLFKSRIKHEEYDYIIYFGDTDVFYSEIVEANIRLIAFLENRIGEISSPLNSQNYGGRKEYNYYHFVKFNDGDSMSHGIYEAIKYFKGNVV